MEKKWRGLIIIAVVVILIVISLMYLIKPKEVVVEPYYSDNPKTWVDDKPSGIKEVNVDKVTGGGGYVDELGLQYKKGNISTAFLFEGYYRGNFFLDEYRSDNRVLMKITDKFKPFDGVIEGIILVKIEEQIPRFHIFVDDDWITEVVPTNVMYGIDSRIEQLDFEEIQPGIFYSFLDTDEGFFDNFKFHLESVMVGDFTQEKIDNEDNDITMMVIQ